MVVRKASSGTASGQLRITFDRKRRLKLKQPTAREWTEQKIIFDWQELMKGRYPELALLNASMNGLEVSNPGIIVRAKLCGMQRGYPDVFLPVAKWDNDPELSVPICFGLYIELKRKDYVRGKKPTDTELDQDWWRQQLSAQGYRVELCRGAKEAIDVIRNYLGIPPS